MFTTLDKALAALILAILSLLDLLFNIHFGLDEGTVATIATLLAPVIVWAIPNKKPSP